MKFNVKTAVAVAALLVVGAGVAGAQDDPVKQRQAMMKDGVAANVKAAAGMVKGETPFDAAKASAAMKAAAEVPDKFVVLLVDGTFSDKNADTTAKPEVKTNMDDFKKRMDEFETALLAAATAADEGADKFKASFAAATKHCGGCHETYRIKK